MEGSARRSRGSLGWLSDNWQQIGTFAIGAFGFVHEVVFVQPPQERPFLIAASMALMGLPFLFAGETMVKRRSNGATSSENGS
jgi:hypothetical protein